MDIRCWVIELMGWMLEVRILRRDRIYWGYSEWVPYDSEVYLGAYGILGYMFIVSPNCSKIIVKSLCKAFGFLDHEDV